jgi:hypothetical protein
MRRFTIHRLAHYRNRIRGGPDKLIVERDSSYPTPSLNSINSLDTLHPLTNPYNNLGHK